MSGRLENSKARNIRLVGLDLDGTVFTDEKTITPATKDAIARAVRAGVAVLPVTGRPRSGLPEEVLAIPGVRYAITSNGAMCEDLAEGSVLVRLAMDEETALRALHIAEKYDVVIDIYIDGQAYTAAESMQLVQTHVPESFLKRAGWWKTVNSFCAGRAAGRRNSPFCSAIWPSGRRPGRSLSKPACSSFPAAFRKILR